MAMLKAPLKNKHGGALVVSIVVVFALAFAMVMLEAYLLMLAIDVLARNHVFGSDAKGLPYWSAVGTLVLLRSAFSGARVMKDDKK